MESRRITTYRALASTSRVALMDVLRCGQGLTVAELSTAVSLHPNTTREHLSRLIDAGLVTGEPEQRASRGRPRMFYRAAQGTENIVLPPDYAPKVWLDPTRCGAVPAPVPETSDTETDTDSEGLGRRVCHEHHNLSPGILTSAAGPLEIIATIPFAHESYCVVLLGHTDQDAGQFEAN